MKYEERLRGIRIGFLEVLKLGIFCFVLGVSEWIVKIRCLGKVNKIINFNNCLLDLKLSFLLGLCGMYRK